MRSALLAFVAGCWLLQQMATLPSLYWALVLPAALPLLFRLWHRPIPFRCMLVVWAAAAGFFWATALAQYRLADVLPTEWEGEDIEIVGVVADLPKPQERGERFQFDVEKILTPGAHVPARISLTYYTAGFHQKATSSNGKFHPGERWQLSVRLKRPHGSYNPSGFDFEAWALERGIRAAGYIRGESQRLRGMVYRPSYIVERLREGVREHFQDALGGQPYEGVLRALAIGDESGIARADWQVFIRTGINHLVSISGLHVTMVASLFLGVVYWGWRRIPRLALRLPARKAAAVAGFLAALAYALLAGFAVPTQRTVYMLAVIAMALWQGRNISMSLVLCWALFTAVLFDPWAVLSPGFWLSYGAVAAMAYACSGRLARPHWLHEAAHTQWVVTLALMPLLLALFQQVSIVSPLANAFAIPVVSFVVVPLTLLGAVIPVDAILLAAHQVMAWCMWPLQAMSELPVAVWQQHAPTAWTVAVALLGMLWLMLPRGLPARWLGLPACLPMFMLTPPIPQQGELRVAILDVGQGLSAVVQTAHHALLYDAGPRFSAESDSGGWTIVPYLRAAGVSHLDGFIVSHDDLDHSGGAASVLDAVPVGWFVSSLPNGNTLLDNAPQPRPCFAGQRWQWDGVEFEMLRPAWESYELQGLKDNFRSCVLKVSSRYGSLLLPGDIEHDAEAELVATQPGALSADVIVAPHHGSKTSSTAVFLQQVHPAVAVFTVGYRNRFGHPKAEVVARYRDLGSQLYRSDMNGMVQLDFDGRGITTQSWRQARPRYWLAESVDAR